MGSTEENSGYRSAEERMAAMDFENAKGKANIVYANRNQDGEVYDSMGQEILPTVELTGIYKDSSIANKIASRERKGLQRVALFSDIDNTFYHRNDPQASERLTKLLEKMSWGVVYVTGRDQKMVESQEDLPKADIVVGAVGTEIYVLGADGKFVLDEEFRNLLLGTWDRNTVLLSAKKIVDSNEDVKFQPRDNPENTSSDQPPQEFKMSFHVFGSADRAAQVKGLFDQIHGVSVILSTDIHDPNKHNIDLLPVSGGKELAVQYLTRKMGIRGVVAGDSGNDVQMLTTTNHPAILVGGAQKEARAIAVDYPQSGIFDPNTRKMPNGRDIRVGDDTIDRASNGIVNALQQPDLNPEDAKWFVATLYNMSRKE